MKLREGGSSSNYKLINQLTVHVKFWGKNEQKLWILLKNRWAGRQTSTVEVNLSPTDIQVHNICSAVK